MKDHHDNHNNADEIRVSESAGKSRKDQLLSKAGKALLGFGILFILSALILFFYNIWSSSQKTENAARAVSHLEEVIALNSEEDHSEYRLVPEKEMPTEEVNGIRYCGLLKMTDPSFVEPVQEFWSEQSDPVPARFAGNAYQPGFMIGASNDSILLPVLQSDGTGTLLFTDLYGNEFEYRFYDRFTIYDYQFDSLEENKADLVLFVPYDDQWLVVLGEKISPES